MIYTIYLVGQISIEAQETYLWRQRFIDYMMSKNYLPDKLSIINPCSCEWNSDIVSEDYKTHPYSMLGSNILPSKDYTYVLNSDIIVANLNIYDKEKIIIGSFYELAWSYGHPEKTVIGIYDAPRSDSLIANHPFVKQTVDTWVKTELQAAKIIERFFI